jgi:uncharacterized protein (DUF1501 family)
MYSNRREFIRRVTFSLGSLAAAGDFARFGMLNAAASQDGSYKALVCVFMYGGNDSNNLIVPLDTAGYNAYSGIRKNLAIAQSALLPVQTAKAAPFGFHNLLPDVQKLFTNKQLAVVANIGSLVAPLTRAQYIANQGMIPLNLFSHLDQQTQWQTSVANGMSTTGWGGRVADQVSHFNGGATFPTLVYVTGNSIFGSGQQTVPGAVTPGAALGLTGIGTDAASVARSNALQQLLTLDSGVTLIHQASSFSSDGLRDSATLNKALSGASALKTVFPATSLGGQLQEVAKLIQVRQAIGMNRQIFFCSLGSFDTHTNQLNDQGTLFSQLSPALAAFFAATQELNVDQQVTTFTESDFSRTTMPNGTGGTDHAWGSHQLVMGGAVQGGDLYGRFPQMVLGSADDVGEGRWLPSTSVDQYGATLAQWFGVSPSQLSSVFPNIVNFPVNNLGFLG